MFWQTQRTNRRLKQLEDGMENVERALKRIQLEWEDTYDKLRVLMQRIVKRAQRIEELQESPPERQPENGAGEAEQEPSASSLSGRAAEINQRILARRNRLSGRAPQ